MYKRQGKYTRVREMPAGDEEVNYNSKTGLGTYCQALNTKTLTPTNPKETPKGPTIEEMLQEIEDQFANTNIPVSYTHLPPKRKGNARLTCVAPVLLVVPQ